jgi:hypothetical protein
VKKFYVYIWLDGTTIFYVGKGCGNRSTVRKHNKRAEGRRRNAEKAGTFKVDHIFYGSEQACYEIETFLISSYGSIVNGGKLLNFTEGGDGLRSDKNLPPESKQAMIDGGRKGGYNSKPSKEVHALGGKAQGRKNAESGHLLKLANTRYRCLVTGYESTAAGLSRYQKSRGIDTRNRIKLS